MDIALLVSLFLVFVFSSLPVAVAIGCAVICFTLVYPMGNLSFVAQNMYSALNSFPLMAVPFFMLTGTIMEVGGLSQRLVRVANRLVGSATSGLAMVTIVACMFFGAISGSAPATVAAIGSIMVPQMVKHGYSREFGAGLIATSGGLGIIIPPSIPLVIYGICTTTSIGDLFLAGIGPGILIGLALMIPARLIGKKRGYSGTGEPFNAREFATAAWEAKYALFVPVLILGGIYGGIFTPTEASIVGVVYAFAVSMFIYKELKLNQLLKMFSTNAALVGTIFLLFGTANSLSFLVSATDLPSRISDVLYGITSNKYVILFIINIFLLCLGMIMDTMSANLIFSPLLLAIVQPLGVDPVHFGVVVTINLALGFVTPPMATNLFLTSTLTGVPIGKIVKESFPFIVAMLIALALVTLFPQISLFPLQLCRG
ncbi:MAG: TRAP transporter large permease [Desulfovibrionaceae bacterium]|jgi:C4-dicarboxylate transporter DctM subunit|nr:TRAP transporter large permease [Desulfovibrionaceae bacterium]